MLIRLIHKMSMEVELWEKGQEKADDEIFDMDEIIQQGLIADDHDDGVDTSGFEYTDNIFEAMDKKDKDDG